MIIEMFINLVFMLIDLILKLLPDIPNLPSILIDGINTYIDLIVDYGMGFIGFFVRPSTVSISIPIVIFIINFEYVYSFIIWFIKKIPFFNFK